MIFHKEDINQRRHLVTEMLQRGICDVTFTKVNGELRKMPCTLNPDLINFDKAETKKESKKKPNLDNLSVWCIDKNEWRSFKLANVIEVIPSE